MSSTYLLVHQNKMFGALITRTKTRGSETFSEKKFDDIYSLPVDEVLSIRLYLVKLDRDRISKLTYIIANNYFPNLSVLEICRPIFVDTTLEPIIYALKENTTIEHVSFERAELGSISLEVLRKLLASNTTLKSFEIPNNNISSYLCGYIFQGLLESIDKTEIRHLNLSGNEIGDIHVPNLCKLVKEMRLTILDLAYTDLTDVGAQELFNVFKETNSFEQLYLNNCEGVDESLITKCLTMGRAKGSL